MDTSDKIRNKASLEDLAKLPENNPGPVFQFDVGGTILLANVVSRNLFGNHGVIGNNWMETCPGFSHENWTEVLNSKEPLKFEIEIGECIFIFTFVRPGKGDFVYAYGNDITDLRQAQKKLSEQAARLGEMARFPEMNPGPVLKITPDGTIILANAAARNIFGKNLLHENWLEIFHSMNKPLWQQILVAGDPIPVEAHIGNCDYIFAHRHDPAGELVFVYGSDITYQKKTERALLQSEKLATLGTLAAGVAHELNNPAAATTRAAEQLRKEFINLEKARAILFAVPLNQNERKEIKAIDELAQQISVNPISLSPLVRCDREAEIEEWMSLNQIPFTELAASLVDLGLSVEKMKILQSAFNAEIFHGVLKWMAGIFNVFTLLHDIGQGSGRVSEIVGALKNYTFLDKAPIQMVNLHDGIDNTLVILRSKMKQGITVNRNYGHGIPAIMAYGSELNQVWTSLLDNATDAMKGEGEICIRTYVEKDKVVVEIEDNGPGIPAEIQSRIFDPFFTTKAPGKGTGLGLTTSYGIITEKHNGTMRVASVPGKTCFTISLPIENAVT